MAPNVEDEVRAARKWARAAIQNLVAPLIMHGDLTPMGMNQYGVQATKVGQDLQGPSLERNQLRFHTLLMIFAQTVNGLLHDPRLQLLGVGRAEFLSGVMDLMDRLDDMSPIEKAAFFEAHQRRLAEAIAALNRDEPR